jgi:hypothetical protein
MREKLFVKNDRTYSSKLTLRTLQKNGVIYIEI